MVDFRQHPHVHNRTFRDEVLDIWKNAAMYFNNIAQIVKFLPENVRFKLDARMQSSALSIVSHLARGTNSKSEGERAVSFNNAIESVHLTVSASLIANQWKYLRDDQFQELYKDGKILANRIKNVCEDEVMEKFEPFDMRKKDRSRS